MIETRLLRADEINAWRERLKPFVEAAAKGSGGRYWPRHIFGWAEKGEWQFWIALDAGRPIALCATEIIGFETGLKLIAFRICTGHDRLLWERGLGQILAWAKANGCSGYEGLVREGWWRVLFRLIPGCRKTHVLIEGTL